LDSTGTASSSSKLSVPSLNSEVPQLPIFTPAACGMSHNRRTLQEVEFVDPAVSGAPTHANDTERLGVRMVGGDGD
jgi:hypothetical protein